MVVVWSALSYALHGAPAGIPRRVLIPNTWDSRGNWSVVKVNTPPFDLISSNRRSTDLVLQALHCRLQANGVSKQYACLTSHSELLR